jgi:hypothetical protein
MPPKSKVGLNAELELLTRLPGWLTVKDAPHVPQSPSISSVPLYPLHWQQRHAEPFPAYTGGVPKLRGLHSLNFR